ncbi:MAG TPA: MAPEG family protein [Rhodanobacter sp.]|nr:MAPEG family protein [Rhodanobacter sp.]
MTTELCMLLWSAVLGLVQIALAATCSVGQRGLGWAASARDEVKPPLSGIGGRLDRARANFLETFPLYAAVVLAAQLLQHHDAMTVLGAQLYFWARLAYVPVYAAGIPYLRTLIWAVSIVGIALVLVPLL